MTQDHSLSLTDADFDEIYRGQSGFAGIDVRFERIPWDIGEPQQALVELERAGAFRGDVLDSGCGLGENALFLAGRGYRVWGFDASPIAIERATELARERGSDARFEVADVTRFDGVEPHFDTVLDSALYHCLGDPQRAEYAAALHRVTRPGAQLHLFCFADSNPDAFPGSVPVSQDDLHANLDPHWNILSIEETTYTSAFSLDEIRRQVEQGEIAKVGFALRPDALSTDDQGRVLFAVWQVRAERR
ncbi:class I SAM-dependent methyltransferase [Amycolatopsis nigrescens]|uniref:class I SAM-dependent methyltransferase n=1 Tax=Amycolatopsis nigrescens TaxID=381445 RepID=UPI000362BDBB|nr:class I SAM-dependent methyltransferase [Amycolatopsis nigrescens]